MTILAIDPGCEASAWVLYDGTGIRSHHIESNEILRFRFIDRAFDGARPPIVVFEQIESYGMAVGREVFDTVFWTGRLLEAASKHHPTARLPRRDVKLHLCQNARAKDTNIRQALLDRFGGRTNALGYKAHPGPLYGLRKDEWAALAVAVTWLDQHAAAERTGTR